MKLPTLEGSLFHDAEGKYWNAASLSSTVFTIRSSLSWPIVVWYEIYATDIGINFAGGPICKRTKSMSTNFAS